MAGSLRRRLRSISKARALSAEERVQHILDERTELLAARTGSRQAPAAEAPRALICSAGRERFGIAIDSVAEVLPYRECMPVPDGPPAMVGVFGRGGHLVSVIDLAMALGMEAASPDNESWHLVLLRREQPQVALRVDRADEVSPILPLPGDEVGGFRSEAIIGHAEAQSDSADQERILSLLDIDRLLRPFLSSSPVSGV
jgi:purine-binding chemotaxis protein CheW